LNILITGAGGFIADSLSIQLSKDKKNRVYGLGRKYSSDTGKYHKYFKGEVNYKNLTKLKFIPNIIYHCAGSGKVFRKINKKHFYDNYSSLNSVLNFFSKNKIKFFFISSAAVYGNNKRLLNEKSTLKPVSDYGKIKVKCEKLCKKKSTFLDFKFIIVRLFSVYGEGLKKQIFWDTCKKFKDKLFIFQGTGNEQRDYIHIDDVVSCLIFLKNKSYKKNFNVFNVGSGKKYVIKKVLDKLRIIFNVKKIKFSNKKKLYNPDKLLVNIKKIKNLGWKPKKNFDYQLKKYVEWFKKNYDNSISRSTKK
jgi:nucleoside-diphosphate-sugar epimerase